MGRGWKLGLAAAVLAGGLAFAVPTDVDAAETELAISEDNFPDEMFRKYVTDRFDIDENGSLSQEEIDAVTDIGIDVTFISSLKGIEVFTKLSSLNVRMTDSVLRAVIWC